MSGPEVVVRFDEEGAKGTLKAVDATDKHLLKLNRELKSMSDRADMAKLRAGSDDYRAGVERLKTANSALTKSLGEQKSAFDRIASGANKINEIFDAVGKAASLAAGLGTKAAELANAGAVALDVAAAYDKLGDAAPKIERMKRASAGVIDETSLQGFAKLASEIGATSEEIEGATQRMAFLAEEHGRLGETTSFMTKLVKGRVAGLRELGIVIDLNAEEFAGLTEEEKKLAVFQKIASQGTQEQVDSMDSAQAAMLRQSTTMADMRSNAEAAFAEFVMGSGILDMVGDALEWVTKFANDNSETFAQLGEIAKTVGGIIGKVLAPALDRLAILFDLATTLLGPLLDGLDILVDANNALMTLIPDLDDVATTFFVTDMPVFKENQDKLNESVKSFAQRSLEAAQALRREKIAAEETAVAIANIHTRFWDMGVARTKNIKLADREIEATQAIIKGTTDQGEALDLLIERYGETESAIEALTSSRQLVMAGRSAAMEGLRMADEGSKMAETFRVQRDEFNATAGAYQNMINALQLNLDAATTVKDVEDELTKSVKGGNEAEEERIRIEKERLEFDQLVTAMMQDVIELEAEQFTARQVHQAAFIESMQAMKESAVEFYDAVAEGLETQRIAEELAFTAEAEAGMLALGEATVFSAQSLAGWGDQASVVMNASIGLAKGLQASASGADSFNAVISASESVAKGAIKDETSLAVVLGSMTAARSAMAFAGGNFIGGLGYAGASAQFFATAAMGGKGGSGGGGAGGTAAAEASQTPTAADVFEQPEVAAGGGGGTVVFNIQSFNKSADIATDVMDMLNDLAESGGGGQLHPSLVGLQQGRSGI